MDPPSQNIAEVGSRINGIIAQNNNCGQTQKRTQKKKKKKKI
jgi:hypothetical protein